MSYLYHNLRTEYKAEGIFYRVEAMCHEDTKSTVEIDPGQLATWAPTTAYVMGWQKRPWNQHGNYEVLARDVQKVTIDTSEKGNMFSKAFYVLDENWDAFPKQFGDSANDPVTLTYWTPIPAYIFSVDRQRLGPNWLVTVKAVDIRYNVNIFVRTRMLW